MPINRRNARAREQAELTDHLLPNEQREQLETLYTQMAPAGLKPLWEALAQLVPPHPNSPACAHLWSYEHARDFLMRAGDLISAEQAERRVLILRSEEHTSELQSLIRLSFDVFCLKKNKINK